MADEDDKISNLQAAISSFFTGANRPKMEPNIHALVALVTRAQIMYESTFRIKFHPDCDGGGGGGANGNVGGNVGGGDDGDDGDVDGDGYSGCKGSGDGDDDSGCNGGGNDGTSLQLDSEDVETIVTLSVAEFYINPMISYCGDVDIMLNFNSHVPFPQN